MVIERYSHVSHIVSGVSGSLRPGVGPVDVLRATFPHGTVSGAPKVRAMEIIAFRFLGSMIVVYRVVSFQRESRAGLWVIRCFAFLFFSTTRKASLVQRHGIVCL